MKSKILVAGWACLSIVAVGQQSTSTQKSSSKTTPVAASSKAATGNTTGKTTAQDKGNERSAVMPSVGGLKTTAQDKKSAQDSWQSQTKASRVSAGDVNGDGKADKMATGKRQHGTVVVTKTTDAASPK